MERVRQSEREEAREGGVGQGERNKSAGTLVLGAMDREGERRRREGGREG